MIRCQQTSLLGSIFALALLATLAAPTWAAEEGTDLDPYLSESTVAILRVNLQTFDPASSGLQIAKTLGLNAAEQQPIAAVAQIATGLRGQLIEVGVTDVNLVFDLEQFPPGEPYVLFRYKKGSNRDAVRASIDAAIAVSKRKTFPERHDFGGVVFGGAKDVLETLRLRPGGARPKLREALTATQDHAVQIVFGLTADQHRVLRETLPAFPAPFSALDGAMLSRGVQFVSFGATLTPKAKVDLLIQSADADAATTLKQSAQAALNLLKELPAAKQVVPRIEQLVAKLQLEQEETRLRLTIAEDGPIFGELVTLAQAALAPALARTARSNAVNRLKQLMLAMHNYHDGRKVLPAHANYSPKGKPLLSWRVHILPFVDAGKLYSEFDLDEPWDSPHNRKLIAKMPRAYRVPGSKVAGAGKTGYVLPILKDGSAITTGTKNGNRFRDITDGLSNTIMIVEVDDERSVIWTKPDDLVVDPGKPLAGLRVWASGVWNAAIADGSVRGFPTETDSKKVRALLTRAGGEVVSD